MMSSEVVSLFFVIIMDLKIGQDATAMHGHGDGFGC